MLEISIFPKAFYIGGVNVGVSVLMAWCVLAVLLVFLVIVRLRIRKFKQVPTGFQNLLEMAVDGLRGFASSHVGEQAADFVAPVTMTLMCYVFFTTVVELLGLPPATEDINCTFALGLCSFVSVNVAGVRFRGVRGRLRALANPMAVAAPMPRAARNSMTARTPRMRRNASPSSTAFFGEIPRIWASRAGSFSSTSRERSPNLATIFCASAGPIPRTAPPER